MSVPAVRDSDLLSLTLLQRASAAVVSSFNKYQHDEDDVVTDSNWTQTLPALVLRLLVRLVLELVLSAGPGPAVAADVLRAL